MTSPSRKAPPRKRKPARAQFPIPAGVYTETRPPPARWRGLAALLCLAPIFGGIWLIAPPAKPPVAAYAYPEPRPTAVMPPVASVQQAALTPAHSTPEPAKEPVPASETLYVTGKRVPMRDAAAAGAPILDRLASGQSVTALERRGDWVKVRHDLTQREGWMQAKRLTVSQPRVEESKPQAPRVSPALSTAAIAKLLIAASLASYPSSCAYPYNTDRGGRSCGRRSAYSRPGGYAPLCYASDITPEMVAEYRASR